MKRTDAGTEGDRRDESRGTGPQVLYRLNPHQNSRPKATSMFDVAKAIGAKLVQGERWGDDYLVVEGGERDAALIEELLEGEGIFFEKVDRLPAQHQWQLT